MKKKSGRLKYLYCPIRLARGLHIERHRVVREGPNAIDVELVPDGWSEMPRRGRGSVVRIDRFWMERAWNPSWDSTRFDCGPVDLCPLGRFFMTETGARFALELWFGHKRYDVRPRRGQGYHPMPTAQPGSQALN